MERPYLHPSGLAQGSALRLDSRHRAALRPPERAVGCCRRYDFSPRRSLPIQQRASPMRKPARSAPTSAAASPKSTSSTRRIAPISTSRASFARRRSCTVGSWTTRRCPRSIRAVEIGSGRFGWYMRLARALERSGQTRVALSYRRHAQRLDPAVRANAVAIGDALATLDGRLGAADHYQRLAKRWPRDPVFALHLARARLLADPAATGGSAMPLCRKALASRRLPPLKTPSICSPSRTLDQPALLQRAAHAWCARWKMTRQRNQELRRRRRRLPPILCKCNMRWRESSLKGASVNDACWRGSPSIREIHDIAPDPPAGRSPPATRALPLWRLTQPAYCGRPTPVPR
jgi:hypothetical protein